MPEPIVKFNKQLLLNHVREGVHRSLDIAKDEAHNFWNAVVPIGTDPRRNTRPHLKDTWFSYVKDNGNQVVLVIGASAKFAIFVELGAPSINQLPKAPLRTTAAEITALLPYVLREKLSI